MRKFSFKRLAKLLPVLALVIVLLTTAAMATETTFDTENFKGLVLTTTASDVSVALYDGRTESAAVMTPVYTEGTTYYYEVTAGSTYYYIAKPVSGSSRYKIRKNVYISAEEAQQKTVLDVTPEKRTTSGWDTWNEIIAYSDEANAAAYPSSPELWPEYDWVFTTPTFTNSRTPHKQTIQDEMMAYIDNLDCDQTKPATLNYSCNLDLNGCNANIAVAAGKTLTVCDSTTGKLGVLAATGTTAPAEGYDEITVTGGKSYPKHGAVVTVPGDMDGNGTKDTDDAVYLLLHMMFGEGLYPIDATQNPDVNKDGRCDTDDAVYLLLHVMFGAANYPI